MFDPEQEETLTLGETRQKCDPKQEEALTVGETLMLGETLTLGETRQKEKGATVDEMVR